MELVELKELKDLIQTQKCEENSTIVTFRECGKRAPAASCWFCAIGGIL